MFHLVAGVFLVLIYGLPLVGLSFLGSALPGGALPRALFLLAAPVLYAVGFGTVAGLLSTPFHRAIVPGSFPRDLRLPAYRNRRFYGLCFTAVFYCTPIYWIFLTVPPLKRLLFRLFGYRGTMKFTVYPDTWIRDLPILELGEGAYVANKATIGTNVCLNDGTILVDRVRLGAGTMVGHLSMLAPGVVLEDGAECGVGVALGMRVHLGKNVSVGGCCDIGHLTRMEEGSSTGTSVDVGAGSRIGPKVHVPAGVFVPQRSRCRTPDELRAALDGTDAPPRASAVGATGEFRTHWNAFE
jgi:acetyltransferase-like isoleucine patch superfamily enzyme